MCVCVCILCQLLRYSCARISQVFPDFPTILMCFLLKSGSVTFARYSNKFEQRDTHVQVRQLPPNQPTTPHLRLVSKPTTHHPPPASHNPRPMNHTGFNASTSRCLHGLSCILRMRKYFQLTSAKAGCGAGRGRAGMQGNAHKINRNKASK